VGLLNRLFGLEPYAAAIAAAEHAPTFAVDEDSIPAQVFGLETYSETVALEPRIDRSTAMQVPAVKRSRDLICPTLGGLPLSLSAPDRRTVPWRLFERPEGDRTTQWTLTKTAEDLLLEQIAWWRVLERDVRGYPVKVRRLHPRSVTVQKDGKVYVSKGGLHTGTANEWVEDRDLIRFDSPNDGLLTAGARAIRTCLKLDAAAARNSDGIPAIEYFVPKEGVDPGDDAYITSVLNAYEVARRNRSRAYVPAALKLETSGWNPEELQLAEARQHAVLEIARMAGVDPEELGVSVTSRTYSNQFDRRKSFIDFTLGPYMTAIEQTLSGPNVVPQGYRARFDLDAFLRSDPAARYAAYAAGKAVGALTDADILEAEDKPLDTLPPDPTVEPAAALEETARA
jgi:HK97 family phage portal protein